MSSYSDMEIAWLYFRLIKRRNNGLEEPEPTPAPIKRIT
jgi:hypothetical protein